MPIVIPTMEELMSKHDDTDYAFDIQCAFYHG